MDAQGAGTPCPGDVAVARSNALIRTLRVMGLLKDGRQSLRDLARAMQVTTRTIRRDLAALTEAGVVVETLTSDDGEASYWWIVSRG